MAIIVNGVLWEHPAEASLGVANFMSERCEFSMENTFRHSERRTEVARDLSARSVLGTA